MSDFIFHYTRLAAASSIISSQTFRATNIATFDDKNELFGGLHPIDCYLKKVNQLIGLNGLCSFLSKQISALLQKQSMYKFFCISFCKNENNCHMWEKYASKEVCLKFERTKLLKAFLRDPVDFSKSRKRETSVVSGNFMPCDYIHEKDIKQSVENYLKAFQLTQTIKSEKQTPLFDFSSSPVAVRPLTRANIANPETAFNACPHIDIDENFINLIKPSLVIKYAGTQNEYEKEDEERVILVTPSNMPEKRNDEKNKSYIEVKFNPSLFFEALCGIKICPFAPDKEKLRTQLNNLNDELSSLGNHTKTIHIAN